MPQGSQGEVKRTELKERSEEEGSTAAQGMIHIGEENWDTVRGTGNSGNKAT